MISGMAQQTSTQPIDPLAHLVGGNLDEPTDGAALADAANYSRFYFQRLFRERKCSASDRGGGSLHPARAATANATIMEMRKGACQWPTWVP